MKPIIFSICLLLFGLISYSTAGEFEEYKYYNGHENYYHKTVDPYCLSKDYSFTFKCECLCDWIKVKQTQFSEKTICIKPNPGNKSYCCKLQSKSNCKELVDKCYNDLATECKSLCAEMLKRSNPTIRIRLRDINGTIRAQRTWDRRFSWQAREINHYSHERTRNN